MNLTKMIYLASPYTFKGPNITKAQRKYVQEIRYEQITRIAGLLIDKWQYAFILPITMSHSTAKYMKKRDGEFKFWENIDLTYISRCDELWVVTMDGWGDSIGVQAEIMFANEKGIKVRYVDPVSQAITKTPMSLNYL